MIIVFITGLPYFTYMPEPVAIVSGSTATLLCGANGIPTPIVQWFVKRGNVSEPIQPSLRHIITEHALLILDSQPSDQGHYFCTITSSLQSRTSQQAHLRVYGMLCCHGYYWLLWLLQFPQHSDK